MVFYTAQKQKTQNPKGANKQENNKNRKIETTGHARCFKPLLCHQRSLLVYCQYKTEKPFFSYSTETLLYYCKMTFICKVCYGWCNFSSCITEKKHNNSPEMVNWNTKTISVTALFISHINRSLLGDWFRSFGVMVVASSVRAPSPRCTRPFPQRCEDNNIHQTTLL